MRIRVVSRNNGLGLSKDVDVLREALAPLLGPEGLAVANFEDSPTDERYDLTLFLERVAPQLLHQSRLNWYVPNPEWHDLTNRDVYPRFDRVLAKTRDCQAIFSVRGISRDGSLEELVRTVGNRRVEYVGWTSPDLFDPSVTKEKRLLHVAGGSLMKGTEEILAAMAGMPDLKLDLVSRIAPARMPPNVAWHGRVSDEALRGLMNRAAVHLCPSSYEGFGHYINEARSVGASIITTNAAPMNELVRGFGFQAAYDRTSRASVATLKHVSLFSLAWVIRRAMSMPLDALVEDGAKARAAYLSEREAFQKRIRALVSSVNPRTIVAQSKYGPIVINRNDTVIGKSITETGAWAADDIALIRLLIESLLETRGRALRKAERVVFFDVGANIGTHTLPVAKMPGVTVHAFEAQREMFDMLSRTISLNGLTNVRTHLNAVSDRGGQIEIALPDYDQPNNFGGIELMAPVHSDNGGVSKPRSEWVETVTIDSLNQRVDFLKMDIEGMEDRALRGAAKTIDRYRPISFIEVQKTDRDFVYAFFRSRGYVGYVRNDDLVAIPQEHPVRLGDHTLAF